MYATRILTTAAPCVGTASCNEISIQAAIIKRKKKTKKKFTRAAAYANGM